MVQRWIVTISEDNLQAALKHKVLGVRQRYRAQVARMRAGDTVVFYVSKKRAGYGGPRSSISRFGPIVQVSGGLFRSDTPIWNSRTHEVFPYRVPMSVLAEGTARATDVVPRLGFIRFKDKWGAYLLPAVRQISDDDFEVVRTAVTGQVNIRE